MRKVAFDPLKCMACRTCEVRCSVAHSGTDDLFEALLGQRPSPLPRVRVAWAPAVNVPLKCLHCDTPPCLLGCPVGAVERDPQNGLVRVREERCVGCFTCVLFCPVGAVGTGRDGKRAYKCDGCFERLGRGEEPACASSCPTKALFVADFEEVAAGKRTEAAAREAAALAAGAGEPSRAPSCLEAILKMREVTTRG